MDVEKALLDQNLVLGEIKGGVNEIKELQRVANGRVGKIEADVETLKTAKATLQGQISTIKWLGGVLVILIGIAEFVINHYWK